MKTIFFITAVLAMLIITGMIIYYKKPTSQDNVSNKFEKYGETIYEDTTESLILSFSINGSDNYLDGEVIIDNSSYHNTTQGKLLIYNHSAYPKKIVLKIANFKIFYEMPASFNRTNNLRLIVPPQEYERYKKYLLLSNQDIFKESSENHWNHMPLTYTTNFSEYKEQKTRESKELKIKYALERLQSTVPSISFVKISDEAEADLNFYGEIPPRIREANRPEGHANTIGLALHNVTGNIIYKATVYTPLPTEGEECPSSDIALHELLHTFSLGHSTDYKSVLWDTASCTNNEIVEYERAFLNRIYNTASPA
jgi:hypothetical protein